MKKTKKLQAVKKGKTNLALLALAFLIILLLLGKGIKLALSLNQPLNGDLTQKTSQWNRKNSISVVIKSSDLALVNYDPNEKRVTVLSIPLDTYVETSNGYGSWPIGSIYALGEEEKIGRGAILTKQSVASVLGLPVDRFILVKSATDSKQIIDRLHKGLFSSFSMISQIQTDMSPLELWSIQSAISKARSDKIDYLNLANTHITESKLLPDSTRVLGVDKIQLDLFVRENLTDDNILKDAYSIAVFNATAHPGLASDAARIVTNLGGNVIITGNSEKLFERSAIIVMNGDKSELSKSYSYSRLASIFAPTCQNTKCGVDDPKIATARAQIIIVLGEDYYLANYRHN